MKKFFEDKDVFKRFLNKLQKSQGGCWNWTGSINNKGYGEVRIGNKKFFSHRASWIFHFGEPPVHSSYHGMCVLHKCDNRKCVNPEHLFLGTNLDNVIDMFSKGRKIYKSKIDKNEFSSIRKQKLSGMTFKQIAKNYGVSVTVIRNIVLREFKSEYLN